MYAACHLSDDKRLSLGEPAPLEADGGCESALLHEHLPTRWVTITITITITIRGGPIIGSYRVQRLLHDFSPPLQVPQHLRFIRKYLYEYYVCMYVSLNIL